MHTTTAGRNLDWRSDLHSSRSRTTTPAMDGNDARTRVIIDGSQNSAAANGTGFCTRRLALRASRADHHGLHCRRLGARDGQLGQSRRRRPDPGNSIGDYFVYPVDPDRDLPCPPRILSTSRMAKGNLRSRGVILYSTNTTVGGNNPQENNIICGNGAQGILVEPGASGNQILGNQIGMAGPSTNGLYSQDGNGAKAF